jgi:hypothetical protein
MITNPPNKNIIEFVNTEHDATRLEENREPRSNKRPTNDDTDKNEPDNKRSKNDGHVLQHALNEQG